MSEILCRVTVGLYNPETRKTVRAGSFALIDPEDTVFGPLIGKFLIPTDDAGNDLPAALPDERPEQAFEEDPDPVYEEAPVVVDDAGPEDEPLELEDDAVEPQEPSGDAGTPEPLESLSQDD